MEYDRLLAPLKSKRRRVIIGHAGQLPDSLIELERYLSVQPEIWAYRFFRDGMELIVVLEKPDSIPTNASHLLAVLPDDMALQPEEVSMLARRNGLRILVILGKALRSEEDRRLFFYIRGG